MKRYIIGFFLIGFLTVYAQEKLKIGVLSYGTVNWELDVLKHNKLDKKYGFDLQLVKLASKNAQTIALQADDVDMIVHDWVWINLQKYKKSEYMFYPYSKATGTLVVNKDSNIYSFSDLKGKKLGIAGGKYSKTWLLFKAYYEEKYKKDFEKDIQALYSSPAILYQKMLNNSLNASINFWHFNSKLEPLGIKPLVEIDEVFNQLGLNKPIPFIGWTFSKKFALKNKKLINSFIHASHEAKDMLLKDETQWDRIKTLMHVKDNKTFESLKKGYKRGVIKSLDDKMIDDMKRIYKILALQSDFKYIDKNSILKEDIFWKLPKEGK